MSGLVAFLLLVGLVSWPLSIYVGYRVGLTRGRPGWAWGLLLSWLGVLIVWELPPVDRSARWVVTIAGSEPMLAVTADGSVGDVQKLRGRGASQDAVASHLRQALRRAIESNDQAQLSAIAREAEQCAWAYPAHAETWSSIRAEASAAAGHVPAAESQAASADVEAILRERYARGEIDREQLAAMRRDLGLE